MNKKEIVPELIYQDKQIEYTKELFRNIIWVFAQLKYKEKEKYKIGQLSKSTYDIIKKEGSNLTDRAKKFCYYCFNYFIKEHSKKFVFNHEEKCFQEIGITSDKQFHNGTYYGYFKTEEMLQISHFILLIRGDDVEMWSRPKTAQGRIIFDRHTFSMILSSKKRKENYEFYLGNNSDNPNLKYFITLWRDSASVVRSVICMIKYVGKMFKKLEDIEAVKSTIKSDMESKMPIFAKDFFKQHEKRSVSYDITGYEYE
jgi:hypothetical protein